MSELRYLEFVPGTEIGEFDEEFVKKTEKMINLKFPTDFVEFLKKHNGGAPKKRYFKLGSNVKVLETFLAVVPDYKTHPRGELDIGVVWTWIEARLNDYLLPFAAVYPGDYLCFDYETGDPPKVVLWIHDQSEEDEPATEPVAGSFAQFLEMLTEDKNG
jgi:hypothetical protein